MRGCVSEQAWVFLSVLMSIGILSAPLAAGEYTLRVGSPEEAGMSAAKLKEGLQVYRDAVEADQLRGAVLLVARRGVIVLHEAVGWRNREEELPMQKDGLFKMASNTKPVVATAILQLAEQEKLRLNDNVRRHIPSWDNYRAGYIKIRHLLTHTSGLRIPVLFFRPLVAASDEYPDAPSLRAEVHRFGRVGADEIPGTTFSYNNPGYNTLGRLIEIGSDMSLKEYLKTSIYEPLGMHDSWNHESDAPSERMSRVYRFRDGEWHVGWSPEDGNDWPIVRASGGMISSASDYAIFCQMFLNGGSYDGQQILNSQSVAVATVDQTQILQNYGFGWFILPDGNFGHGGSDGTYAWLDPSRELFGLVFTQSTGGPQFRDRFRELISSAVDD